MAKAVILPDAMKMAPYCSAGWGHVGGLASADGRYHDAQGKAQSKADEEAIEPLLAGELAHLTAAIVHFGLHLSDVA